MKVICAAFTLHFQAGSNILKAIVKTFYHVNIVAGSRGVTVGSGGMIRPIVLSCEQTLEKSFFQNQGRIIWI